MKILREREIIESERYVNSLKTEIEELKSKLSNNVGKVFLMNKSGKLFPTSDTIIEKSEGSKKLSSVTDEWVVLEGLLPRPYDPLSYLTLYENNPTLFRTINQIATDAAGLGYTLPLQDGKKVDTQELQRIQALLDHPSDDMNFRQIMNAIIIDLQLIGDFGIEVVRGKSGKPSGMNHIRASELWVAKEENKFCQKKTNQQAWFRKFRKDNSVPKFNSVDGKLSTNEEENDCTELYFHKLYNPRSSIYGIPPLVSATGQIVSMIGIRDYNLAFFLNFGVPEYLVTLKGKWDDSAYDDIHKFFETELKKAENAHKTLVMQLPIDGTAEFTPISVQAREGSFRLYLDTLREDVMAVYSMPPYRIGIAIVGKLSGSTARELNEIYKNGVIEPIQDDLETMMDAIINSPTYKFKFVDLDINDEIQKEGLRAQQFSSGQKTLNQILAERGEKPIDKPFADWHWTNRSQIPMELLTAAPVEKPNERAKN